MNAVRDSLARFGQRVPIVVRDGIVIAGNARLEAARALGWEHVAIISADDLTPEQAAAYGVADNRTAELAEWDFPVLGEIMNSLEADLRLATGFDQKDFERMFEDPTRRDQGTGDLPFEFKIVIDCADEKAQSEMLKELMERGVKCRAMTL
jgi:ParB-like chromosome segregation protein Spo0J